MSSTQKKSPTAILWPFDMSGFRRGAECCKGMIICPGGCGCVCVCASPKKSPAPRRAAHARSPRAVRPAPSSTGVLSFCCTPLSR